MKAKYLVLVCFVMLSACQVKPKPSQSTFHKPMTVKDILVDGPPSAPAVYKPKPVKPDNYPLSRYGNQAEYRVNGKTYDVLLTSDGYKEKGIASWYGMKFHEKATSSGEEYNLYEYTAAHKTLPLPSYVKVTNQLNGRSIVVKVNDRGPFHDDRLIDLSFAAAKKLGFLNTGTAPVLVEAVKTKQSRDTARLFLQAGAFSKKEYADNLKNKLSGLTLSPIQVEHFNGLYVVKIGPLASKTDSSLLKNKLLSKGFGQLISLIQ